jgi:hypothetical protein
MLTASVYLDLTIEPELHDSRERRELGTLQSLPDGVRVVIDVGSRTCPTADFAAFVHPHIERLDIDIRGDKRADHRAWLKAARKGHCWLVVA